jgi:MHS family proline/betaine transporter-like MFS transporter
MIFGGLAPFILQWLIELTGSKLAPSFYVMFGAGISLIALAAARGAGFR